MARCGCTSACSCKIVSTDHSVTITGTGSSTDPYDLAAAGGGTYDPTPVNRISVGSAGSTTLASGGDDGTFAKFSIPGSLGLASVTFITGDLFELAPYSAGVEVTRNAIVAGSVQLTFDPSTLTPNSIIVVTSLWQNGIAKARPFHLVTDVDLAYATLHDTDGYKIMLPGGTWFVSAGAIAPTLVDVYAPTGTVLQPEILDSPFTQFSYVGLLGDATTAP